MRIKTIERIAQVFFISASIILLAFANLTRPQPIYGTVTSAEAEMDIMNVRIVSHDADIESVVGKNVSIFPE